MTNFRRFWPSFPSSGFYVALTRPVNEDQLILLSEPFNLRRLRNYGPSEETLNEYARLWDLFKQTFERMNPNEPIPSRLDGRPRLRSNIREPIGLTNSQNYCWLTSYLQLLVCMDDPIQTVRSNDNERVRKLKQEMIKTLLEMKASQKTFLPAEYTENIAKYCGLEQLFQQAIGNFLTENEGLLRYCSYNRVSTTKCKCSRPRTSTTLVHNVTIECPETPLNLLSLIPATTSNIDEEICSGCQNIKSMRSKVTFSRYITIFIKRAKDGYKVSTRIEIPELLNGTHRLCCIIEHIGEQVDHGHFVSYANRSPDFSRYYRVDDRNVSAWQNFAGDHSSPSLKDVEASILLYMRLKNEKVRT